MNDASAAATQLRESVMALARQLRRQPRSHDLSQTQLMILSNLDRRGPATPVELAAVESVRPQSLTRPLNALETAGLIARRRGGVDRRQQLVELTASGRALLAGDRQTKDAWLTAAIEDSLTPLERDLLALVAPVLRRLAET